MNSTLKWLWQVPGRKKALIAALTAAQVLLGGCGVLYALLLRSIVNSAVAHEGASFWHYVMLMILLVAGQLMLQALIRWLGELSRATLENTFKQRLTGCILRKDYASVSAFHTGEWLNRLTNDCVIVANGYAEILPGLAGMIVRLVSALVMLIVLDRFFALVMLPGGAALVAVTYAFRKVLKRLHKSMQESDGRLRGFLQEHISSLMIVKSFAAEEQTEQGSVIRMNEHKAARLKKNYFSNFCNVGFGAAMQGMFLFGVICCACGILNNTVSYGTLTAVMQLMGQVQAPFTNISGYLPRYYAMLASAERLMTAETFPDDCPEPMLEAERVQAYYRDRFQAIALRNADFSYPLQGTEQKEIGTAVFQDLSLEIRKGEYTAFTGTSGCGKSTVLKLLMCIYPLDDGERLLLDREGAVPLTAEWRRLFAYVPQGNQLMSGKLRDAVAFACPEQADNDEKLLQALSIACADEFLPELENGLDTMLGERGAGLSEGQMQRLAIARAIFADNPILLLDESTSALDEGTEKRLLHNIRSLTDKTVIIVTHRKTVLSICDRVLEFTESGMREMPGTPGKDRATV